MSERKERCETCRFFDCVDKENTVSGVCHRHAPRPAVVPDSEAPPDYWAEWPQVFDFDWCGEWRAKEAVDDSPALWTVAIDHHPAFGELPTRAQTACVCAARRLPGAAPGDRSDGAYSVPTPASLWVDILTKVFHGDRNVGPHTVRDVKAWLVKHFPKETASGLPESSPA